METVENLMVGEHAAARELVHESFVERAFHGGEFYLVAAVGEDIAQSLELAGTARADATAQAATVLATIRRDTIEAKGGKWSADEEEAFKAPIRAQYDREGHPYYAIARLWDDGVIDPADTRRVLALAISASLNRPIPPTRFGVFRM